MDKYKVIRPMNIMVLIAECVYLTDLQYFVIILRQWN